MGEEAMTPEVKAAIEELNGLIKSRLDGLEALKQKAHENGETLAEYVQKSAQAQEHYAAMSKRLDQLELITNRPGAPGQAAGEVKHAALWQHYFGTGGKPVDESEITLERVRDAKRAFVAYLRKGDDRLSPEEVKLLSTQDDTQGGYLVEPDFGNEIIKDLLEISPVRSIARVTQTASGVFKVPRRTGTPAAAWVGEGADDTETNATYGLEEIPNGTMRATTRATREQLGDSAFDIEAEIRSDSDEAFRAAEGSAFVNGDGVEKPEGFMTDADVDASSVTGDASNLTYSGLVDVSHGLNSNYLANARFVFNLATLGKVRLLEDTAGHLIFLPATSGAPSTILGWPYTVLQDMTDVASGATPVAFGDFARAYRIVQRMMLDVLRDPFSAKRQGAVEFTMFLRVGGQVVLPTAIRKLTVST